MSQIHGGELVCANMALNEEAVEGVSRMRVCLTCCVLFTFSIVLCH